MAQQRLCLMNEDHGHDSRHNHNPLRGVRCKLGACTRAGSMQSTRHICVTLILQVTRPKENSMDLLEPIKVPQQILPTSLQVFPAAPLYNTALPLK